MCGIASASRMISIGADVPVTVTLPSMSGSDRRRDTNVPIRMMSSRAIRPASPLRIRRRMAGIIIASMKAVLDRLYDGFNLPDSATDPIQIVRRYPRADDREVVGFIAAALAFGRV